MSTHTRSAIEQHQWQGAVIGSLKVGEVTGFLCRDEEERFFSYSEGVGFSFFTLRTDAKATREKNAPDAWLPEKVQGGIVWSSFLFSVLQSVCTFFIALGGLRLVIGAGALAAATQAGVKWDYFHQDWIRIPMVGFALFGSLLNLVILRRIRRLRKHPAAQWRQRPVPTSKIRIERVQFVLSWITLALVGLEEITHFRTFHHF